MKHPTNHIFGHTPETLGTWCDERRLPAFRAKQILDWVYAKGVVDPEAMSNLSKREREMLREEMVFLSGDVLAHQQASDGTQKLLVQWTDGDAKPVSGAPEAGTLALPVLGSHVEPDMKRQTECVMIPADDRRTACISSQVGCPVGCRFCASGLSGLDGNLSAGRIVEQVWRLSRILRGTDEVGRVTNVVFMGMGEPLSNLGAVVPAVRTLAAPWGMGISARRITISTVGLPKAIEKLAEQLDLPVTLALSLHAPDDAIRRQLIPWAEYTTIEELLGACQKWFQKTGREITLEYTLLRGVNDRPQHAKQLAELAKTLRANVNLIRYNEVEGLEFKRPRTDDVLAFQQILVQGRVNAHIRASRGRDIAAACGQLRHQHQTA
ncbi:MAG: 23S rRNA (adenine(2503)-C(2))-methyltransferase RlmN [Phycisphaeraceae bacterium]|nr:23S rRNA (adenine(2503)-C(2))-methyltransferase RlmN [Phycisphaeraceae bacterium]QYK49393.1 MAG: 23S rRNA (adenine(2503)-C(2))-methyltransferase RlmN [Phycisphaeraceae bacterium]